MIVTINGTDYTIQTSWKEVTDADALLKCETFRHELKALSNITDEIIYGCDDLQLFPLYTLIGFIDDMEAIELIPCCDVALKRYEQLELAKMQLREGKPYQKLIKVSQVYYPKEKNVYRLIGLGASLVTKISNFLSNYAEMAQHEPDQDELAAGVEDLSGFGAWGTVYEIAQKDITKVREIFRMRAIDVYTALQYSFRQARYMKRLHEIRHPKK